jgi:hypothetical protein
MAARLDTHFLNSRVINAAWVDARVQAAMETEPFAYTPTDALAERSVR